jgi:hypothetical protein
VTTHRKWLRQSLERKKQEEIHRREELERFREAQSRRNTYLREQRLRGVNQKVKKTEANAEEKNTIARPRTVITGNRRPREAPASARAPSRLQREGHGALQECSPDMVSAPPQIQKKLQLIRLNAARKKKEKTMTNPPKNVPSIRPVSSTTSRYADCEDASESEENRDDSLHLFEVHRAKDEIILPSKLHCDSRDEDIVNFDVRDKSLRQQVTHRQPQVAETHRERDIRKKETKKSQPKRTNLGFYYVEESVRSSTLLDSLDLSISASKYPLPTPEKSLQASRPTTALALEMLRCQPKMVMRKDSAQVVGKGGRERVPQETQSAKVDRQTRKLCPPPATSAEEFALLEQLAAKDHATVSVILKAMRGTESTDSAPLDSARSQVTSALDITPPSPMPCSEPPLSATQKTIQRCTTASQVLNAEELALEQSLMRLDLRLEALQQVDSRVGMDLSQLRQEMRSKQAAQAQQEVVQDGIAATAVKRYEDSQECPPLSKGSWVTQHSATTSQTTVTTCRSQISNHSHSQGQNPSRNAAQGNASTVKIAPGKREIPRPRARRTAHVLGNHRIAAPPPVHHLPEATPEWDDDDGSDRMSERRALEPIRHALDETMPQLAGGKDVVRVRMSQLHHVLG